MPSGRIWLLSGALLTSAVTALHVAIIVGGPGWYRFFGAGERMAQLAERGSVVPVVVTAGIAGCLTQGADAIHDHDLARELRDRCVLCCGSR